jgi:hypothetical protein
MIRLYNSMEHPGQWIAYMPDSGWVVFPNSVHGWEQRKPVRGLDPIHLRQVSPALAAQAGFTTPTPAAAPAVKFKRVA